MGDYYSNNYEHGFGQGPEQYYGDGSYNSNSQYDSNQPTYDLNSQQLATDNPVDYSFILFCIYLIFLCLAIGLTILSWVSFINPRLLTDENSIKLYRGMTGENIIPDIKPYADNYGFMISMSVCTLALSILFILYSIAYFSKKKNWNNTKKIILIFFFMLITFFLVFFYLGYFQTRVDVSCGNTTFCE